MSDGWRWNPERLTLALRQRGYDVDERTRGQGNEAVLTARRERAARGNLIAIDAAGRFKAEMTLIHSETGRGLALAGLDARLIATERLIFVVTTQLPNAARLGPLLDALDRIGATPAG